MGRRIIFDAGSPPFIVPCCLRLARFWRRLPINRRIVNIQSLAKILEQLRRDMQMRNFRNGENARGFIWRGPVEHIRKGGQASLQLLPDYICAHNRSVKCGVIGFVQRFRQIRA